jgi:hypothetical protein
MNMEHCNAAFYVEVFVELLYTDKHFLPTLISPAPVSASMGRWVDMTIVSHHSTG